MAEEEPEAPQIYWFNVKYGENESALFNMDCWAIDLIGYIKERCGYGDLLEPVDLMKEDGSACMNLRDVGTETAIGILEPKASYILVKVNASETEGGPPTFENLWEPPEGYEAPVAAGKKK